jgi:hypothetical protein
MDFESRGREFEPRRGRQSGDGFFNLLFLLTGQPDSKIGAVSIRSPSYHDPTAVVLGNLFDNRQAQTRTRGARFMRRFAPEKPFK